MYRPVVMLLTVVAVGVVRAGVPKDAKDWASLRSTNPTVLANRVLDDIVEAALVKIEEAGWDDSKNVQNGVATFPLTVDSNGKVNETFSITKASIEGIGSLDRSKSGSLDASAEVVSGTLKLEDVTLSADYVITFPGAGQASPETRSGQVTVLAEKIFVDIAVNVDEVNSVLVPQNINSYDVRTAYVVIQSVTNMSSSLSNIHKAGIRKALRQVLENTTNTNVKVKINQGIQALRAAASSGK